MRLRFQKGDVLAIALVALLALIVVLLFVPQRAQTAYAVEIYQNGQLVKSFPLLNDVDFTIDGAYTNTVSIRDGRVCISRSDCPGQDCVHCGSIRAVGRSIVCLPNAVEVRIVGQTSDVDFVVG